MLKSLLVLFIVSNVSLIKCWPDFHLYTQRNPNAFEKIDNITNSIFYVENAKTKFLIHGFGDNGFTTDLIEVKKQLLLKENLNVIVVDWKDGALMPNYLNAASNTQVVAAKVALFIRDNQIDPKRVHCIGHSLGAHTCGFIGKLVKLKRISGLDPAGPLFRGRNSTYRLDKSDADFVDVINVDGFYGIHESIGHKNFYPSGGKNQPGCGLNLFPSMTAYKVNYIPIEEDLIQPRIDAVEIVACSHVKVNFYYAESVKSKCKFTSLLCNDYENFKNNKCSCDDNACISYMGYHSNIGDQEGNYYLEVNKDMPFCKS